MVHRSLIRILFLFLVPVLSCPMTAWTSTPASEEPRAATSPCPSIEAFSAEARTYVDSQNAVLTWTVPDPGAPEGYFLYRYNPEDPAACLSPFNRNHFYKIYYNPTPVIKNEDGDIVVTYTEPLDSAQRLCYAVTPFCHADAYRGGKSGEQCVCADLREYYSRKFEMPGWVSNGVQEVYVDYRMERVDNGDYIQHAACSGRTVLHSDEWTEWGQSIKPLLWNQSVWNITYYNNCHSWPCPPEPLLEVPLTSDTTPNDVPLVYSVDSEATDQQQDYHWSGPFSYTITGLFRVDGKDYECSSTFSPIASPPLLRTPEVEVASQTGFASSLRSGEYWGCDLCEPVTLMSTAPNYDGKVTLGQSGKLFRDWRYLVAGDTRYYLVNDTPSITFSQTGAYTVNGRNEIRYLNQYSCFSDPSPDDLVTIYDSPPNPWVEGPLSICRDSDGSATPTTFTVSRGDGISYDAVQWYECLDEFGECYFPEAPSCFTPSDRWDSPVTAPDYALDPPPDGIKQKQLYIRGYNAMAAGRDCYGQQFLSIHYKEDCRYPQQWTHTAKSFFPATSVVQEDGPLSDGHSAGSGPIVHSNLLKGAFALKDTKKLTITAGTYELAVQVRTSGAPLGSGRIMAYVNEYATGSSTPVPLPPVQLTPEGAPSVDGWRKYACAITPVIAQQLLFSVGIEYFSGWVALDDISLIKSGTTTNLLDALDHEFEGTTVWNFPITDPLYPGTGFLATDGGSTGQPIPARNGRYLFYHNLASGGIYSGDIAATGAARYGVRVGFDFRGEEFTGPGALNTAQLYVQVEFKSNTGTVGTPQSIRLPFAANAAWARTGKLDLYPSIVGAFSKVVIHLGAQYLDGWVAFDNVSLSVIDAAGAVIRAYAVTNAGFESGSCVGSVCSLSGWTRETLTGYSPATSVFHPAYFSEFAPVSTYNPFGPIASSLNGGRFAVSISNQMWGVSTLPTALTVTEKAEYEVSLWARGTLLHKADPAAYTAFVQLKMTSAGTVPHSGEYVRITPITLTSDWRQHRFTVVAEEGATVQIQLMSPYLSGFVAMDDVAFGLWNRPPMATVPDVRYIPNQEEHPELFAGDLSAYPGILLEAQNVYDPDSHTETVGTEWLLKSAGNTGDTRFVATSRIDTLPDNPLMGGIKILDSAGAPAYLRLNRESKFNFGLLVQDGYNPDLYTDAAASATVEPFYALNPNFEASTTVGGKESPVYWTSAVDPGFPATGVSLYGPSAAPRLTGARSILRHNLATGYITGKDYFPPDGEEPLPAGLYTLSVALKGILRTGTAVLRVRYFNMYEQSLDAFYGRPEYRPEVGGDWSRAELPFMVPEPQDAGSAVWHLQLEIGIEQADGWVIFDDAGLLYQDPAIAGDPGIDLLKGYDPGFEETEAMKAIWDYKADNSAEYPNTATIHYAYNMGSMDPYSRYPWVGGPPAPNSPDPSARGVIKGNFMMGSARYAVPIRMAQNATLKAKFKWDLLGYPDASGTWHRGRAVLWVTLWDGRPPQSDAETTDLRAVPSRVVNSIPVPITFDRDTAGSWVAIFELINKPVNVSDPYLTFALETDMLFGWLAMDDVQVVISKKNMVVNGSFESGSTVNWRLLPATAGTGIFADSKTLFSAAGAVGTGYLAFTQLAYGHLQTPKQDIAPGVDYALSFWHRGEDLHDAAQNAARARLDYYKNGAVVASTPVDLVPTPSSDAPFTLYQGMLRHPSPGGFTGTEQVQLKIGVEKMEGWLQTDGLILKPAAPAPFVPNPVVDASGVTCASQYLLTQGDQTDYQWFYNNQPEGCSVRARQLAFASGNFSVSYTDPSTEVNALGFAVPVGVAEAPELAIYANRPRCYTVERGVWYVVQPGTSITLGGYTVNMLPVENWAWDFGDGTTGTGITETHTYYGYGSYTVTLQATHADCVGAASVTICVPNYFHPCYCTEPPIYDAAGAEVIDGEEVVTAYTDGDSYDQTAVTALVVEKTVAGKAEKQNINSKKILVAMAEELLFAPPDELFAQFEADGEKITRGELKRALYSAAKQREKDQEQEEGGAR